MYCRFSPFAHGGVLLPADDLEDPLDWSGWVSPLCMASSRGEERREEEAARGPGMI